MYIPQFWCGVLMILLIEAFGIIVFSIHFAKKEEVHDVIKKIDKEIEEDNN